MLETYDENNAFNIFTNNLKLKKKSNNQSSKQAAAAEKKTNTEAADQNKNSPKNEKTEADGKDNKEPFFIHVCFTMLILLYA